ncbi:hypothetical protein LGH83_10195 [Lichenihabitans sp. PAMC28606]|uniref:hypothetical protein n=1 Tax=Lichenihabitans sp. PAMC28606 TaxID=2880932 RepID=UPI001D09CE07|nr:hypothetical protein [Lichenihabitans sp. PAMC28606]UDL93007.1 hypothetical protein LGH83_10195 [Lichenihabitans sp. PAMC28606]
MSVFLKAVQPLVVAVSFAVVATAAVGSFDPANAQILPHGGGGGFHGGSGGFHGGSGGFHGGGQRFGGMQGAAPSGQNFGGGTVTRGGGSRPLTIGGAQRPNQGFGRGGFGQGGYAGGYHGGYGDRRGFGDRRGYGYAGLGALGGFGLGYGLAGGYGYDDDAYGYGYGSSFDGIGPGYADGTTFYGQGYGPADVYGGNPDALIQDAPRTIAGYTPGPAQIGTARHSDQDEEERTAIGNACRTPVKTCDLYEPAQIGGGCSCKVAGRSRARGAVVQ